MPHGESSARSQGETFSESVAESPAQTAVRSDQFPPSALHIPNDSHDRQRAADGEHTKNREAEDKDPGSHLGHPRSMQLTTLRAASCILISGVIAFEKGHEPLKTSEELVVGKNGDTLQALALQLEALTHCSRYEFASVARKHEATRLAQRKPPGALGQKGVVLA